MKDGFYNQERSKFKVPEKIKSSKFLDIILNQILYGRNDDKEKRIIFRTVFNDVVEDALKNLGIPFTKKYTSKRTKTKNIVINSKIWYEILMKLCNYMDVEEITADNLEKSMLVEVPGEIVIDEKEEIKEINILEYLIKNKSKILEEDAFLIKNLWVKYKGGTIRSLEGLDKINGQEMEIVVAYNYNPKINYSIPVVLKIDEGLVTIIAGVVTEGWLGKTHLKNRKPVYSVSFSNKDKNIIKKFSHAAESIFGKHPKNYLRENGVTTVTFGSKITYLLFKYVFSTGEYAQNKKLPDFAIMLNKDNIKSLLDFFKKCDGNGIDEYYTSSEDLASQIKWLLRRLGKGCLTQKRQNIIIIKESGNKYVSFKEANFICVKEKTISDKPEYVYDLSCPDARRYLVGTSPVYVHNSTRPFCFSHDIRFFLKHGLKVDGVGNHTAVAGPARKPDVAFLHAAKVLASAQVNCAGGQGFSYFNTFLAPYVAGLPYEKVKQLAQMFIYEMSMMYVARGGQTVFSSIDCDMEVPEQFKDTPAVLPGGIVKDSTTYSDFEDEVKMLFNALIDVYLQGDFTGKAFNFPKFEVQIYPKKIDKNVDMLLKVSQLAAKFGTPYYIINQPYMPLYACYQCCSFLMPLTDANTEDDVRDGTLRGGGLQVVTINLPQIAYESNRSEEKFNEILKDRMEKTKNVHLLKREIIKKNQNLEMLPFMSQIVNEKGDKYLEVDRQSFIVGLVGMNECVKFMTDCELHEDVGWKFGLKVMNAMKGIVADIRKETGLNFSLARTPAESCSYRLAQIDSRRFPDKFIANGEEKDAYYTNSFHIRPSANVPLWKRLTVEGAFHPLTDGGAMCLDYNEKITVGRNNIFNIVKIGDFVEQNLKNKKYLSDGSISDNIIDFETFGADKDNNIRKIKVEKIMKIPVLENNNMFEIKTKNNKGLKAVGRHKIFKLEDGEIKEVFVRDIKENDTVLMFKDMDANSTNALDIAPELSKDTNIMFNGNKSMWKLKGTNYYYPAKFEADRKFGEMMGFMLSEGSVIKSEYAIKNSAYNVSATFGFHEDYYANYFKNLVENIFGKSFGKCKNRSGHCIGISKNDKNLHYFFSRILNIGIDCKNRSMPDKITFSNKSALEGIMDSLFTGDGSIDRRENKNVEIYATTSNNLADDVSFVASLCGYENSKEHVKRKDKREFYCVSILRDSGNNFINNSKLFKIKIKDIPQRKSIMNGFLLDYNAAPFKNLSEFYINGRKRIGRFIGTHENELRKMSYLLHENKITSNKAKNVSYRWIKILKALNALDDAICGYLYYKDKISFDTDIPYKVIWRSIAMFRKNKKYIKNNYFSEARFNNVITKANEYGKIVKEKINRDENKLKNFENILNNFGFDTIKDIKIIKSESKYVYDIQTETGNFFTKEGILNHNSHVWLGEQNPNPEGILSLTKKIATKTAIQYMAFTKDLTVCSNCNFVTGGLHNKCPSCNSENVDWWSRITGYYQNIKGWNKGKLKELQDRRRYGFENSDITAKEISFTMKESSYETKFEKLKEKLKYDTSLDF